MSKIRTISQLQDCLDTEFGWRLQEIAYLKRIVKANNEIISKKTAVRASIPLLYGHWEGFVKNAATHYLEFVNGQMLAYKDLKSCFVVFGLKGKINELTASRKSETSIALLDFIRGEMQKRAKLRIESAIRTEFNLSSEVFSNIACSIGLDLAKYEARFNLIDESLLGRRNYIAHGQYLDIEPDGFRDLADETIYLLRTFKTDIENAVTLKSYKNEG